MFLCFADVINIMLVFQTNKVPFSAIFETFGFLTQITKNYAIFVICTKNKIKTIWLNKNDNKKQTSRSFSILFSVMGSLEIVMGNLEIFSDFCSALSRNSRKH